MPVIVTLKIPLLMNMLVYKGAHKYYYVVGSQSFRPDIQKPRQMENAVRDI